jgi:hypothetical protein
LTERPPRQPERRDGVEPEVPPAGTRVRVTSERAGWDTSCHLLTAAVNGLVLKADGDLPPIPQGELVEVGWGDPRAWLTGSTIVREWSDLRIVVDTPMSLTAIQRRAFFRVRLQLPVQLWRLAGPQHGGPPAPRPTVTMDLSAGGMRCETSDFFKEHESLGAILEIPGGRPIPAVSSVVEQDGDSTRLQFTQVSEADRARILAYLNASKARRSR